MSQGIHSFSVKGKHFDSLFNSSFISRSRFCHKYRSISHDRAIEQIVLHKVSSRETMIVSLRSFLCSSYRRNATGMIDKCFETTTDEAQHLYYFSLTYGMLNLPEVTFLVFSESRTLHLHHCPYFTRISRFASMLIPHLRFALLLVCFVVWLFLRKNMLCIYTSYHYSEEIHGSLKKMKKLVPYQKCWSRKLDICLQWC